MKKKMKKIFSKLTVLVLLVAMLIPYTCIPKVEAAETCPEGTTPEYYTNYYFFLVANTPHTWVNWLGTDFDESNDGKGDGKVVLTNYTSFLYTFPADGSKIIFEDEGFVKINNDDDYKKDFNAGTSKNRKEWDAGQFYYEWDNLSDMESYYDSTLKSYAYQSGTGESDENRIVTYLFHGDWANVEIDSEDGNPKWNLNEYDLKSSDDGLKFDDISDQVKASILINKNDQKITNAKIGAGVVADDLKLDMDVIKDTIQVYNDKKGSFKNNVITKGKNIDQPVIHMIIQRTYEMNDIFTSAPANLNGTTATYGQTTGTIKTDLQKGEKLSFVETITNEETGSTTTNTINDNISDLVAIDADDSQYTWFVGPNLYQMSYTVCKTSGGDPDTEVSVTYHKNTDDTVENMPSKNPETVAKGSAYTISSTEPTRSGYSFQGWATNDKCTGTKYESGIKYTDSLNENANLFACWGDTSEGDQEDTGVLTYAGLFTGIIALAGGSYYLIKKKNLFKKI